MNMIKWLIAGLALLGIYLFLFVGSPLKETGNSQHGQLIESGTFTIEVQGQPFGQEVFRLSKSQNGFTLSSDVDLEFQGQRIETSQTTLTDINWGVTHYSVEVSSSFGSATVGVDFEGDIATINTTGSGEPQSYERGGEAPLIPIDNNVTSHFYLLHKIILANISDGAIFQGTVVSPQGVTTFPIKVISIKSASLEVGDDSIFVDRYELQMGDFRFALYGTAETLWAVEHVGQESIAYRQDLLPEAPFFALNSPEVILMPDGVAEFEHQFESAGLNLSGTLTLPENAPPNLPIVLMIHGSGPTDRDENGGGLEINLFRDVAYRLAEDGFASFRYDKRGVATSEGVFTDATMQDLLDDATAAIDYLVAERQVDKSQIYLLGHSEGGILAPILAQQNQFAGLLLLAGSYHPLDWILIEQTKLIFDASGLTAEETADRVFRTVQFTDFVKSSSGGWSDFTFEMIKEQVPELTEPEFEAQKRGMSLEWYREHFAHDPGQAIKNISIPVLIIQGDKDLQVPREEATRLGNALTQSGNNRVQVQILDDLNHLMRFHPDAPSIQYRHLDDPVDPRVLSIISKWILER
jgi:hypothetical protein